MQKNEAVLLEPWLLHHAALFGFDALTVLDNGSDNPAVLDTLKRYEARGVTVIHDYPTKEDYGRKGEIVADIIREWDRRGGYAFALPLDCDELLITVTERIAWDRASVHAALARMAGQKSTFVNNRMLLNIPHRPGYFRPQIIQRAIFAADTITSLDQGYHFPGTIYPDRCGQSLLACLHLHNRPNYEDIKTVARNKLRHLTGEADLATMEPTEEGYHLYSYFRTSEETFLSQYRDQPDVYIPGILPYLESLGIDWRPMLGTGGVQLPLRPPHNFLVHRAEHREQRHIFETYDAAYYAAHNPDVVADPHYGLWPLAHFLPTGWNEGRRPNGLSQPPVIVEQMSAD